MYSRQAVKKYVKANNNITVSSETQFDSLFNRALKSGVDSGDFSQPKGDLVDVQFAKTPANTTCLGPSGPVKLAKKEAKAAEKKPAAKVSFARPRHLPTILTSLQKEKAPKKEETKEAKPKATRAKATAKPKAATKAKKATTAKKPAAAAKPKANTATKRAPKTKAKAEAPVRPRPIFHMQSH